MNQVGTDTTLDIEAVAALVGDQLVERAARRWITAMRQLAEHAGPTADDVVVGPACSVWAAATADVVEAMVDVEGGVDGLIAARALGVDVEDALGVALAAFAESLTTPVR